MKPGPEVTFRDMNLAVFHGRPISQFLFQPRFEPWYAWHQTFNQMPPAYQRLSLRELYDDLQVSMRYVHYYTGMPDPVALSYAPEVRVQENVSNREKTRIYQTPYGELIEGLKRTVDKEWRTVDFPVKNVGDLRKLRWLYQRPDLPFDGLEALTPAPQGDVSLEEIKAHIGNKVLLDGIPAVLFMDTYSREDLMRTVEEVVALFAPRLILGISDEVPEGAGEEAIERVRLVSQWCRRQVGSCDV